MKILSFGYSSSGCWWVRIKTPLQALSKQHVVVLSDGKTPNALNCWDIVIFNNVMGDIFRVVNGQEEEVHISQMVEEIRSHGTKIVYDTDDAQEIHPLMGATGKLVDDNIDNYYWLLQNADLVTCTTEALKKHLSQYTKQRIEVLPNCIDPSLFPKRKQSEKVKIGYAGSFSHLADIGLAMPAIENLEKKHDIYFETFGFQYKHRKWMKPRKITEYYQGLADLGADIGIAPLQENEFNRNKSPLKFLEYAMVGTVCLASNRLPYKGEMKREWLCNDDEWEGKLEKLIVDKEYREKVKKEQYEWVLKNRDIQKEYKRWEKVYRSL